MEATAQTMQDAIEIIPRRLYWVALNFVPQETENSHYFSVDDEFVYEPFCKDFGPLNLGMICRYCVKLHFKLRDPAMLQKRIVHVCSVDPKKRANAACLMGAFQVLALRRDARTSHAYFDRLNPPLKPWRDASTGPCSYQMTMKDCLDALQFITEKQWFDWTAFNAATYEHYSQVEYGDMNWIIPGKFLAFAGPFSRPFDEEGFPTLMPEDYVESFQKAGINLVVRLNKPCYDRRGFTDNGVNHIDLYFKDGSCPSADIISAFLHVTAKEPGGVAVHCKAGLGRTCTLIGLYAMKHHFFPARAFIAWSRICRPGSVLGPQQQFLVDMETEMFQAGAAARGLRWFPSAQPDTTDDARAPQALVRKDPEDSSSERYKEDHGQGERLCSAKRNQQRDRAAAESASAGSCSTVSTPTVSALPMSASPATASPESTTELSETAAATCRQHSYVGEPDYVEPPLAR